MATLDLSNLPISASFKRLIQISPNDNSTLLDGTGSAPQTLTLENDLIVKGNLTAETYIVSSSIINQTIQYISGSTKFGDDTGDTHEFTGSVSISGSFTSPSLTSDALGSNQVVWTDTSSNLTSSANLTFDDSDLYITGSVNIRTTAGSDPSDTFAVTVTNVGGGEKVYVGSDIVGDEVGLFHSGSGGNKILVAYNDDPNSQTFYLGGELISTTPSGSIADQRVKLHRTVEPDSSESYDLGVIGNRWRSIHAKSFSGSMSGSFEGDGSGLTGVTGEWDGTHNGDGQITGSLIVSQSGTDALTVYGSGSDILTVVGSQGALWTVNDSLSGSLFGVGDISGFQQFEVFSDGDVYTGDEQTAQTLHRTSRIPFTLANTTQSVAEFNSSSFDAAFFDYVAISASNSRAGSIMSTWNGGTVVYNETTTTDIGDTSGVSFAVAVTGSSIALQSVTTTALWNIKATIRAI